jgi:outer membrane protein TolC
MRTRTAALVLSLALAWTGGSGKPASAAETAGSPAAATGGETENGTLTLPQALAQALASSPRLEEARSGVALARGQKRGARAEGVPSLEVSGRQTRQGPTESFELPGGTGGSRDLSPSRQFEGNVDLALPLDSNGRLRAGRRSAGAAERAALARVEAEAQRLVLDVTEAYLDALQARQEIALLAEQRRLNQERLRVARVRLTAGVGVPLEVSQPEADLAQAVQREIEAQARLRQVTATLNSLIGRPAAAPVTLSDLTPSPSPGRRGGTEAAPGAGMQRPDLRALRAELERAKAGVDSARAARRPLVGLSGNLVERAPETLLGGFAWSLGSSLVQSLFDGGRSRARVEQARADRVRAGAALAEAERQADAQVEQARAALEAAEQRLVAEDQRVVAATDALSVAQKRVSVGTAAALEVTEAETVLARARTDALTSRFDVRRAQVQYAYVAGVAYPETVMDQIGGVR